LLLYDDGLSYKPLCIVLSLSISRHFVLFWLMLTKRKKDKGHNVPYLLKYYNYYKTSSSTIAERPHCRVG